MKIVALLLMGFTVCALGDSGLPSQPYIYSEGTANTEKPADFVKLSFRVTGRNASRAKANTAVQADVRKAIELLKTVKVSEKDIIAENLTSEPLYKEEKDGHSDEIVGFSVTREMEVTVRDVPSFPKIVDDLIAHVNIDFSSIEPGLTTDEEVGKDVELKALAKARERAENTLKAAGMKIDSVFAIPRQHFRIFSKKYLPRGSGGGHGFQHTATINL
ncbi:MAG: SIMPL domain-containing protein [Chthoniobacterales bacterium]